IRSRVGGRAEERRELCYDQHQVWMVTVVVTLPDTLPCVLRGGSGTGGQGQFLTRILAQYPAILDIATSVSLNKLFGFRGGNTMAHAVHWIMVVAVIVMSCTSGAVRAHGPSDPPHQQYQIGDLKLESGQRIKDFAISYVTHGTLNAKKSNTVLMVT